MTGVQTCALPICAYHATYHTTFNPPGDGANFTPAVEALPWVVALEKARGARGGGPAEGGGANAAAVPDPAASPQPAIKTLDPFIVTQGTTPVSVTLSGVNFVRRSVVQFKGKPMPTQVISPTELKFTLDAEALKNAGRFDLVVINPAQSSAVGAHQIPFRRRSSATPSGFERTSI